MLEELKKQVVKYALQADRSGLCKHRSGNFSVRDPKTGYVCITPTGMDREEMTYHDVVVIDLDANVIEAETAQRRPTSESLMHLEVYKQHPDINAVAHTHSKYATINTVKALEKSDVALMQAHGVIAIDKDLKEALLKASYVEELAEIYYHTLVINNGNEPPYVSDSELQKWEYPKEIKLLDLLTRTSSK